LISNDACAADLVDNRVAETVAADD